jgi:hypothetical protein
MKLAPGLHDVPIFGKCALTQVKVDIHGPNTIVAVEALQNSQYQVVYNRRLGCRRM